VRIVIIASRISAKPFWRPSPRAATGSWRVLCTEKEGAKADVLKTTAESKGIRSTSSVAAQSRGARRDEAARADIGIMAYVLQFAPQDFVNIPGRNDPYTRRCCPSTGGPVRSTGRSSGRHEDGFTIFRQRRPGRRAGDPAEGDADRSRRHARQRVLRPPVPMGVQAMLEAADMVVSGRYRETVQDESQPHTRAGAAVPRPHQLGQPRGLHVQPDSRLQSGARGLDHVQRKEGPDLRRQEAPGADLQRGQGQVGEVVEIGPESLRITCQGGQIEVFKAKGEETKKLPTPELALCDRPAHRLVAWLRD